MNENIFDKLDFGPFRSLLDNDDITDISYDNDGQIWIRSLTQGSMRVEIEGATPEFVEKLAFQCSNVMGTTFNNAKPFLDAESAELRMNFVHPSIATNGIALVIRKTPAKIRLEKDKLIKEDYFTPAIHDLLIKCVEAHCNIIVAGETGSGKTEFVKYLASHTKTNEKIITIEDTLELHLDKIYPQRDIVAMKTNNVASYTDVLVTCMRQNPKWILLSEVRSAEAVSAVRNSISSGHNILSTIHADKASAIPYRLYSLMETDLDVHQFLSTIYRYIQLGVHIKAFYSKQYGQFHREVDEVTEFYVDDNNVPVSRIIYQKQLGKIMMCKPSEHLVEYIENQNISVQDIIKDLPDELPIVEYKEEDNSKEESTKEEVAPTDAPQSSPEVVQPVTDSQQLPAMTETVASPDASNNEPALVAETPVAAAIPSVPPVEASSNGTPEVSQTPVASPELTKAPEVSQAPAVANPELTPVVQSVDSKPTESMTVMTVAAPPQPEAPAIAPVPTPEATTVQVENPITPQPGTVSQPVVTESFVNPISQNTVVVQGTMPGEVVAGAPSPVIPAINQPVVAAQAVPATLDPSQASQEQVQTAPIVAVEPSNVSTEPVSNAGGTVVPNIVKLD